MKKGIKIILIELFFLALLLAVVAVWQLGLTLAPFQDRINAHLDEAEKSIAKYQESEEDLTKTIMNIYDSKTKYVAFCIREGIAEETIDGLQSLVGEMDAKAIYLCEKGKRKEDARIYLPSDGITDIDKVEANFTRNDAAGIAEIDEKRYVVVAFDASEIFKSFNEAYSWEEAIASGGTGKTGYTFVAGKRDLKIHQIPDDGLVGETIKPDGDDEKGLRESIEKNIKIRKSGQEPGYRDFVHMIIGSEQVVGSVIKIENKYANTGEVIPDGDEYVFCVLPASELFEDYLNNGGIYTIVFLAITLLYMLYIYFSEHKRRDDAIYAQKLMTYPLLGMFVVFCLCMFLSRLNMVSSNLLNCQIYAADTVEMSGHLSESTDKVQELVNKQYLSACRIAAKILTENPEYRTREGMKMISSMLNVKYTYNYYRKKM